MGSSAQSISNTLLEWSVFAGKITFGLIALALGLLYANQDKLLYFPNPPGFPKDPADNPPGSRSPDEWNIRGHRCKQGDVHAIQFEEEMLTTPDGVRIHTWLLLHQNHSNAPTLIYFHGNAGLSADPSI
jgi:abhydrolase domain-containing protein 13